VAVTTERWGNGFKTTRRVETEYDKRGKPTKTTVKVPGRYTDWDVVEEVEYWGNGFRKKIIRKDASGEITEIYYYDELGKLKRSAISPGHKAGEAPTTGTWYVPANEQQSSAVTVPSADAESQDAFALTDGFGEDPFAGPSIGAEVMALGEVTQGEQHSHEFHD
ncbi:hypothetical protein N9K06_01950, partial [Omnitrophica bacterium]|nr:hypothetical protein [Candidatus Omnitrophota bacterium]